MIELRRTDSSDEDFINLVKELDAELAMRDGNDHSFYATFNKIAGMNYVVVAYDTCKPVSCGALKEHTAKAMEIKRMYTLPEMRGKGIASKVLMELETWAGEMLFERCILETGKRQPEAIALYGKRGYKVIPNYGQYAHMDNSVCFEKEINSRPTTKPELISNDY